MNDNYVEVLKKYEGEAVEVRRGRGAWVCIYTNGVRLLKEYRGSVRRLEFEEAVLENLQSCGIPMVDGCVRNLDGELLTDAPDGTKFILKEWYLDRECFLGDIGEILTAVTWIAKLHKAFRGIAWKEEWSLGSMLPPGPAAEMKRHNRELGKIRSYIRKKRRKSEFELCVTRDFTFFYEQAVRAQEGLEALEKRQGQDGLFLCHGDLDQHHILLRGTKAAFIEFSQMHQGRQMGDLYHFMRKALEKHSWDEGLGESMMERYDKELPISAQDLERLYYLFLYPEKYWKQLNYYYNANKAWIPVRSVEKLERLEAQQESRNRFLSKLPLPG